MQTDQKPISSKVNVDIDCSVHPKYILKDRLQDFRGFQVATQCERATLCLCRVKNALVHCHYSHHAFACAISSKWIRNYPACSQMTPQPYSLQESKVDKSIFDATPSLQPHHCIALQRKDLFHISMQVFLSKHS